MSSLCNKTTRIALEPFSPGWQGREDNLLNKALLLWAMVTLLHLLSTMNSRTLSLRGFVPLKPKDKTGRKYFKAVYPDPTTLRDGNVSYKKFANKKIDLKTSLMKTFYL